MIPPVDDVTQILRRVATEIVLPRHGKLATHEIATKGPGNYVTIADTESEHALSAALTKLTPGALVVGEEAVAADPAILERLSGDQPVWIIDPVDGTQSFARGHHDFCMIVAYATRGVVQAGWIHEPLRDTTLTAQAGAGAWRDGAPVRLGEAPELGHLSGTLSGRLPDGRRALDVAQASQRLGATRRGGSAGRVYMKLAAAKIDFALFSRTLPWDHAAGVLIHREAGGHAAFLDATPYDLTRHQGPLLMAPSRQVWTQLQALLSAP
jgi:fructose-1,6-bisphosphatase/inositol monophosphatase family enzyme